MATEAKYECEIRFKMSHNEEDDDMPENDETPSNEKKKITLVDATSILKAEAIRQYGNSIQNDFDGNDQESTFVGKNDESLLEGHEKRSSNGMSSSELNIKHGGVNVDNEAIEQGVSNRTEEATDVVAFKGDGKEATEKDVKDERKESIERRIAEVENENGAQSHENKGDEGGKTGTTKDKQHPHDPDIEENHGSSMQERGFGGESGSKSGAVMYRGEEITKMEKTTIEPASYEKGSANVDDESGAGDNGGSEIGTNANAINRNGTNASDVSQSGTAQDASGVNGDNASGISEIGATESSAIDNGVHKNGVIENGDGTIGAKQSGATENGAIENAGTENGTGESGASTIGVNESSTNVNANGVSGDNASGVSEGGHTESCAVENAFIENSTAESGASTIGVNESSTNVNANGVSGDNASGVSEGSHTESGAVENAVIENSTAESGSSTIGVKESSTTVNANGVSDDTASGVSEGGHTESGAVENAVIENSTAESGVSTIGVNESSTTVNANGVSGNSPGGVSEGGPTESGANENGATENVSSDNGSNAIVINGNGATSNGAINNSVSENDATKGSVNDDNIKVVDEKNLPEVGGDEKNLQSVGGASANKDGSPLKRDEDTVKKNVGKDNEIGVMKKEKVAEDDAKLDNGKGDAMNKVHAEQSKSSDGVEPGDNFHQDGEEQDVSNEATEKAEADLGSETEERHILPKNFYYDYDDIVSKPRVTEGVPEDMFKLYHSFGFECMKRSNMHMLDDENILFAAGNVVQILNIKLGQMKYIRTIGNGGVGAIAVHPSRNFFGVAEKGDKPCIVIYEYPSLRAYRILRGGTEMAYANLDFSPNGEKLASVGSAPDYMLTVWDWNNENIELRSKAFSQDVYKVAFSPENEGHLCTSGTGHIRFWIMAATFTGLKLQGELGRFGTTELSDIAGFVELPDGKVLSGSEWGNMLLWDGGLIKVEVARKGKKTCHHGMIMEFFLDEGELITIGIDGCVKVWDFESIDTAEAADESKIFEMEPMSELKVGSDVRLVSMVKSVNPNEASIWYAQDGSGGIWKLDLSFSHTSQAPKRLYSFHAGAIEGLAVSTITHLSATIGADHTVRLYDYLARIQVCYSRYTAPGTSILWLPTTVDPDGLSILTGFQDGVIRQLTVVKMDQNAVGAKKDEITYELKLTQVFKPHVKAVTALAVSKDGKFLATGSDDSTVFFFSISQKYKPIGFIETGGAVASLDWSNRNKENSLLICGKDGYVLEVRYPSPDDYDTSKTFLIPLEELKKAEYKFESIKDRLVKEEDDIRKAKEEEERRKRKEEEKRKKKERGIVEEEEEGEEGEEEEDGDEEGRAKTPKEEEIHEQGQVVEGFYKGDTDNFWLMLNGWDAGYIYECMFSNNVAGEPLTAIKFEEIDDVPVRSYCFSKNGQYMALGLDNGSIRVQILESREIMELDCYWSQNMHDNHYGAVTNVALSFDEKFLLSVGSDGNFFVYSFMDEEKLKKIIGRHKAHIAKKLESTKISRIDDIEDPDHYSIELEKQKAEYDRMVRIAEEKKQQTRQSISLLRREFKRLLSRNQEMPPYLQLAQSAFIIDPKMKDDVDAETEVKLKLVEREMAWESEKNLLSLQKLKKRFKDVIECELFRLHAFKSEHCVSSYRAAVLPPEFFEAFEGTKIGRKALVNETGGAPALSKRSSILVRKVMPSSVGDGSIHEDKGGNSTIQSLKNKHTQKLDGKVAKAIEKAEQNRKRRLERKAKWDELYRSKPDADYEDPAIVAAIKEAQENMGDFKLKSADDYIVPEKERVNADKKRAQIIQLKEQIYQLKANFNEKLLDLRNSKIATIAEVKSLIDQLENVQSGLPLSMHIALPHLPVMHPEEQPEALFEYTSDTLEKFRKEQDEGVQIVKNESTGGYGGGFGGGFGGFGTGETNHQPSTKLTSQLTSIKTDQRGRSTSILSTLSSQPRSGSSVAIDHGSPETISEEAVADDEPSDLEVKVRDEQRIRLVYQRDMLLQKIKDLLKAFDAELRLLRHEKIHLDVDLKNADLRMITLFEELVLLKEFEKRENLLMGKVSQKMQEKDEMEEKVDDCEVKLQLKKGEVEKLQEKEKSLSTMFSNLFLESNKFEAFLTKVYKKKVKRVKKSEQDAGSDDDSDDDLSDDDYDSEETEDSDAEELDDSVCPPGCDQALFDQVCQLRERRLDAEEGIAEEKKAADALKKELDALKKKAKIIESNLISAEADLEAFQREKQQKLNELDIVVTLKLNQLQYLNNSALPQDLSQCLVFTSTSLERLQNRIGELDKEKAEQKKLFWKLRQQHVQLIRDKKSMEEKISQLEEKVQQMQLLKFGRLVDLEKLETVSVNRAAEELKEQLRSQEFSNAKEIAAWEKRIDDAKAKLTQVTRENTQRLNTYTVLLQEKKGLEQTLDSRQKSLGGEFQGNRQTDYQERQRLVQLVQLQSQEIDALKEEIALLSRKGGHILPPSHTHVSNATPTAR